MRTTLGTVLFVVLALLVGNSSVWGEQFRIETEIFVGEEKEPVLETLTIFDNGIVYDFLLTGVEEVTMFDRQRQRLVLMDAARQVKLVMPMDDIISCVAEMKVRLVDLPQFLNAQFSEEEQGWLQLANERISYRAQGVKPKSQAISLEYQEFADWYARLNAMRPRNPPPFLRIQLNSELAQRGLIPKTVERTISENNLLSNEQHTVRSQHLANWRLSQTDRKRLERAANYLATFRPVSFREYFRLHVK